ncbi:MAG: HigA family addiction module antidote protein, partial [Alphaproteobacteria bacterium]|nr:HigA family addiction module antidote protein [Alphaproteobacteria bacterium]
MARTPIHPGEHLAEALEELGLSAAEFARQIAVPTNRITGILNGQRAVTADTALRLGHWFGTSAEMWLNLQKLYELRLAEQEKGAEIKKLPIQRHRPSFRLTADIGGKKQSNNFWPMHEAINEGRNFVQQHGS